MAPGTLTLSGKKFVVIPESEYRQLKARAGKGKGARANTRVSRQERGDIAESRRRLADPRRIPLEDVARELGFDPQSLRR